MILPDFEHEAKTPAAKLRDLGELRLERLEDGFLHNGLNDMRFCDLKSNMCPSGGRIEFPGAPLLWAHSWRRWNVHSKCALRVHECTVSLRERAQSAP